ncbi:Gfo/Idh/MocA family oxidoreductase [soil metagenome]
MASRRKFLTAAAGLTILPSARTAWAYEANERLNLAVFGTLYNSAHMLAAPHLHDAPIVALCDPDTRAIDKAKKQWVEIAAGLESDDKPENRRWAENYRRMARGDGVKIYTDIRKLMDEMGDLIDALVVSQYDHLHGIACGPALRAGKPVLSERPLGMNISDARSLRTLAAEMGLPTTYRSPGTAMGPFRRAIELAEDGLLGDVKEVHIWFQRGGPDRRALPEGTEPVPDGLDWDSWLGPLPWRGYHPDWMAYSHWRETCNGGLGVFGAHTIILPFLTLKMRTLWDREAGAEPIRVTAECSSLNGVSFPRWERVRWEIPARGDLTPVTVTWHHGPDFAPGTRELIHGKMREFGVDSADAADALMKDAGSMLVGSAGALVGNDHSTDVTALPSTKFDEIETRRPLRIPAGENIYRDWIGACRGKDTHIVADFDHGGPLSELLMIGNIATLYPEETLSYDPAEGRFSNKPEANDRLGFTYRDGWRI